MNRRTIAILEDDAERVVAMRAAVARDLPNYAVIVLGTANGMIAWLRDHLDEVALISLDNDLLDPDALERDVGEGRDVAAVLARERPCCPMVLHTSNSSAARAMAETLGESGWPLARVVPHDGVEWVEEDWVPIARRLISKRAGWRE